MASVRIIARAVVQAGKIEEWKRLVRPAVTHSRTEAGCKYYELFESDQPGVFYFNELWESGEHLQAHASSPTFQQIFVQKAPAFLKEPMEVSLLRAVE